MNNSCRCHTIEEAAKCNRAGTRMVRPLWDLCQRSDAHRRLWDGLPQVQATPTLSGSTKLKTCEKRKRAIRNPDGTALTRLCTLG